MPFSPLGKGFLTGKIDENTQFDKSAGGCATQPVGDGRNPARWRREREKSRTGTARARATARSTAAPGCFDSGKTWRPGGTR